MPVSASRSWAILVGGLIGLGASVTLTVEKIQLLLDSGYVPSCNLNPVLSCGSVMVTPQASVFGFPNPLMGIVAFTVVVVTGVLAVADVALPRWYWGGLAIGTAAGAGFVHWLIFQSLYRIGALCPYCMVVWAVTLCLLVIFAALAFEPADIHKNLQHLHRWRWTLAALWFIALFLLIFIRFQDYWITLL
ncbi:vitamin K epoxide reductase family protein [[Mycobacterium] kokjensenii]|uniref:Vitamin K epoxide reductase family protein n=1 Tax=[Mycobacterium] kokjensenii TaxID=3064287 RepID=A0ABN9N7E4_9MYCO|nr:vitamin K epoxide reductase family protein [Mycolicibacter sp. MU0083]CAJ1500676.1 vitamin K epoxide reductase family protein [Mycolicibacter sp. MU0083]